jgi:glycosyltransferase A (GT-A) superfamily protein (DUF2064 family)
MARWPAPGRCKRRLAADLGLRRAAAVQARLTAHGVATARQACGAGIELLLAGTGLGPRALARWGAGFGVARVVDQGQGSLGLRLRRQLVLARREGISQLVLIGSDLPELEAADLQAAFAALGSGAPLVLGPAVDGGYWLLGLHLALAAADPPVTSSGGASRWRAGGGLPSVGGAGAGVPAPRLFAGADQPIAWGSALVGEQTLRAAAREGLAVTMLAPRADLDRSVDLLRWR